MGAVSLWQSRWKQPERPRLPAREARDSLRG